jgi:hypothetical protein
MFFTFLEEERSPQEELEGIGPSIFPGKVIESTREQKFDGFGSDHEDNRSTNNATFEDRSILIIAGFNIVRIAQKLQCFSNNRKTKGTGGQGEVSHRRGRAIDWIVEKLGFANWADDFFGILLVGCVSRDRNASSGRNHALQLAPFLVCYAAYEKLTLKVYRNTRAYSGFHRNEIGLEVRQLGVRRLGTYAST